VTDEEDIRDQCDTIWASIRGWIDETIPEHQKHPWKPPGMRFYVEGRLVTKAEYADDLPDGEWEIVTPEKTLKVHGVTGPYLKREES